MKFTSEESVVLMLALERYAEDMENRVLDERTYDNGGHPEPWQKTADQARALLKRIEDAPVDEVAAQAEGKDE